MRDKVLIVTLEGCHNFGNRLQNYALQKSIEKLGYDVFTAKLSKNSKSFPILRFKVALEKLSTVLGFSRYSKTIGPSARKVKFLQFNHKYIHELEMTSSEVWRRDWGEFRFVITGSDQVWHNWHENFSPCDELSYYYLEFVDKSKRLSYAPSFGFTSFPEDDLDKHRHGLNGIHALSCRELEGCKLIKDLTGRDAVKVLDPTMLLTKNEWTAIERKPKVRVPNRFLLLYFIGELNEEYLKKINNMAKDNCLEILNINDPCNFRNFDISPENFIWLIHHAKLVCTDSFHASVFSIIFNKKLRVFERGSEQGNMFGRLRDLLSPLGLLKVIEGYGTENEYSTDLNEDGKIQFDLAKSKSLKYLEDILK